MGVLAIRILAFSTRRGCPMPKDLSSTNPSEWRAVNSNHEQRSPPNYYVLSKTATSQQTNFMHFKPRNMQTIIAHINRSNQTFEVWVGESSSGFLNDLDVLKVATALQSVQGHIMSCHRLGRVGRHCHTTHTSTQRPRQVLRNDPSRCWGACWRGLCARCSSSHSWIRQPTKTTVMAIATAIAKEVDWAKSEFDELQWSVFMPESLRISRVVDSSPFEGSPGNENCRSPTSHDCHGVDSLIDKELRLAKQFTTQHCHTAHMKRRQPISNEVETKEEVFYNVNEQQELLRKNITWLCHRQRCRPVSWQFQQALLQQDFQQAPLSISLHHHLLLLFSYCWDQTPAKEKWLNSWFAWTWPALTDCRILSMPFGPNVGLTKSAIAIAPTNDDILAFSPCETTCWDNDTETIVK